MCLGYYFQTVYMPTTEQGFWLMVSVDYLCNENKWNSWAVTTKVCKVEVNNELKNKSGWSLKPLIQHT